jgi:hypothetical protein
MSDSQHVLGTRSLPALGLLYSFFPRLTAATLACRASVRSRSYGRSPGSQPEACSWRSTAATTARRAGGTRSRPARTAWVRADGFNCVQLRRSSAVASHAAHALCRLLCMRLLCIRLSGLHAGVNLQ